MPRLRILMVDHDQDSRDRMAVMVGKAFPSSSALAAENAARALEMFKTLECDCAVIDHVLPDDEGLDLARKFLSQIPNFPVVLLTPDYDNGLGDRAIEAGLAGHISKSRITSGSLRRLIDRAMRLTEQRKLIDSQHTDIENFAHSLAHDFKQPLRQISTFVRLIGEELGQDASPSLRKHLQFLRQSSKRLTALVDVMVDYTLLSKPVECATVQLSKVVREAAATLKDYIAEHHGRVKIVGDQEFHGHPILMVNVLRNLIVNGLKYNQSAMPEVIINARLVGNDCEITVSDNGIGIDEEFQESIFSPLVRLHTQEQHKGTGLGLAVVRKALAKQGGFIRCRSTPGKGSTFMVTMKRPLVEIAGDIGAVEVPTPPAPCLIEYRSVEFAI